MRAIREGMRWFLRSGLRWVILALLIVAFLWFVPQLQGEYFSQKVPDKERPALVNEYRRTWAQIIGGFGLLLGLYFTWRRIEISQQELEATRDQQVTERFTRAIDQLGATDNEGKNKKLEIRLGGIYALERIAWDSLAMENSPGRDYGTVMEVLTAYVRENTLQAPGSSKEPSDAASMSNEATAEADEGATQPAQPEPRRPTADIQAILDVLGRAQTRAPEEYRTRLDLHEADLQGADLREANLQGAFLREADLQGAFLQRALLQDANLQGTDLREANLPYANLTDADLREADLQGADLEGADLLYAKLQGAFLLGAILPRANLQQANLQGAFLQRALLLRARLPTAYLFRANLKVADLQGANFQVADLREANLQGAFLQRANFQSAFLGGADLSGTDLRDAQGITNEELEQQAASLEGATMPNGQMYEDWLKDKEGRKEDGENRSPS
jgi:uncharacterized protein YjbI with pentapeptide repeats